MRGDHPVSITVHDEWVWVFDLKGVCCIKRGLRFHSEGGGIFCKAGVYFSGGGVASWAW